MNKKMVRNVFMVLFAAVDFNQKFQLMFKLRSEEIFVNCYLDLFSTAAAASTLIKFRSISSEAFFKLVHKYKLRIVEHNCLV